VGIDTEATPKASGLKTALDVVIAPKEAFESIRRTPTWGWALLIVIVVYAISTYLTTPALLHATQADWPRQVAANPSLAQMTPDQQQRALAFGLKIVQFVWLFSPIIAIIAIVIQTLVMLVFKALGKGSGSFGALWAAAINIQVPVLALNSLVTALIVIVRGPDSFNSSAAIQTAMPSLALLVDTSAVKLHAFLASFNPFTLWGCGLTIAAMVIVARVDRTMAWVTGIVWLLVSAGLI